LHHGETGCVVPTLDHTKLAAEILRLLEDKKQAAKLRHGARAYAEQHLDLQDYLRKFRARIEEATGKSLTPRQRAARMKQVA
jgi:glycosyltransferase involved in cell wall biosynthesis